MSEEVQQSLRAASEEIRSAQQLLEDLELSPDVALIHVLRAWHGIAAATTHLGAERVAAETEAEDSAEIPWKDTLRGLRQDEYVFPRTLSSEVWLNDLSAWFTVPAEDLLSQGIEPGISRSRLESHLRVARNAHRQLSRLVRPPRIQILSILKGLARKPLFWGILTASLLMFALYTAYSFYGQEKLLGHWRIAFYENTELQGEPISSGTRETVSEDWRGKSPEKGVPHSSFSTRWDACLSLKSSRTVRLRIGADDGARLLINGKAVVGLWERGGFRTTERNLTLPAGKTLLTVEYFQQGGASRVLLEIDTGDGFDDIPRDWIVSPRILLGAPSCS